MLSADALREAQYPDEFRLWHQSPLAVKPPDDEDISALAARALEAVNGIIQRHPRWGVGIVSHELPMAVVLCRSAGLGPEHQRSMIPQTGAWQAVVLAGR
jgi:broad specificity phosphatase PhoE